jgi:RNA polymerase-binding transcription factor DksA
MAKVTPTKKTTKVAAAVKAGAKKLAAAKVPAKVKSGPAKKAAPAPAAAKSAIAKKPAPARVAAAKSAPAARATAKKATTAKAALAKAVPVAKKAPEKKQSEKKVPEKQAPAKAVPVAKKVAEKKAADPAPAVTAYPKPPRKPSTVICPLSGFEVKPDKPNLSPRTIERLRAKLVAERERHIQQADELAAEAEALALEREGGDTQFDEESGEGDTFNIERERDLLLSASARQAVDEIDRALVRIKEKTYGLCAPAGRRISLERLEALPYADTCVECKARAERRR